MSTAAVETDGDFTVVFPGVTPYPVDQPFLAQKQDDNEFDSSSEVDPSVNFNLNEFNGAWRLTVVHGDTSALYIGTFDESQRLGSNVPLTYSHSTFGSGWPTAVTAVWSARLSTQVSDFLAKIAPSVFTKDVSPVRDLIAMYDRSVVTPNVADALVAFLPHIFESLTEAEDVAVAALKYLWFWVVDPFYDISVDRARSLILLDMATPNDYDTVDAWYASTVLSAAVAAIADGDSPSADAVSFISEAIVRLLVCLTQAPYDPPPSPAQAPANIDPPRAFPPPANPPNTGTDYIRPAIPRGNEDNFGRIGLSGMLNASAPPRPPEVTTDVLGRMTNVLPPVEGLLRGVTPIARRRFGIHVDVATLNANGTLTIPNCCVNTFEGTVFRVDSIQVIVNADDFSADVNDRQTFSVEARAATSVSFAALVDPFASASITGAGDLHPDAQRNGVLNVTPVLNDDRNQNVASPGRLPYRSGITFNLRTSCRNGETATPPTITRCIIVVTGTYVHTGR